MKKNKKQKNKPREEKPSTNEINCSKRNTPRQAQTGFYLEIAKSLKRQKRKKKCRTIFLETIFLETKAQTYALQIRKCHKLEQDYAVQH